MLRVLPPYKPRRPSISCGTSLCEDPNLHYTRARGEGQKRITSRGKWHSRSVLEALQQDSLNNGIASFIVAGIPFSVYSILVDEYRRRNFLKAGAAEAASEDLKFAKTVYDAYTSTRKAAKETFEKAQKRFEIYKAEYGKKPTDVQLAEKETYASQERELAKLEADSKKYDKYLEEGEGGGYSPALLEKARVAIKSEAQRKTILGGESMDKKKKEIEESIKEAEKEYETLSKRPLSTKTRKKRPAPESPPIGRKGEKEPLIERKTSTTETTTTTTTTTPSVQYEELTEDIEILEPAIAKDRADKLKAIQDRIALLKDREKEIEERKKSAGDISKSLKQLEKKRDVGLSATTPAGKAFSFFADLFATGASSMALRTIESAVTAQSFNFKTVTQYVVPLLSGASRGIIDHFLFGRDTWRVVQDSVVQSGIEYGATGIVTGYLTEEDR